MADNSFFTDKFFESPVYKALQGPYNERMAREAAAAKPAPGVDTRPRSTALTPQSYNPTVLPHDNSKRLASGQYLAPGMSNPLAPSQGGNWSGGRMTPFPPAYPTNKPPIDITVRGGNQQVAGIPLPQARPWNAPTEMDLAAIAALESSVMPPPTASAYAPQPAPSPAVAAATSAAQGQAPQTSWMQDMMTGINGLLAGPAEKPQTPQQAYDAANFMAQTGARNQDRSGVGSDGYVRNSLGVVIGRDANFQGMTPSQQYDFINGNFDAVAGVTQDNSWKTIGSSASSGPSRAEELGFKTTAAMERAMRASGKYDGMGEEAAMEAFYKDKRPPLNLASAMTSTRKKGR